MSDPVIDPGPETGGQALYDRPMEGTCEHSITTNTWGNKNVKANPFLNVIVLKQVPIVATYNH
jgi:hypothetical protein